jgi:hypothetical protein
MSMNLDGLPAAHGPNLDEGRPAIDQIGSPKPAEYAIFHLTPCMLPG